MHVKHILGLIPKKLYKIQFVAIISSVLYAFSVFTIAVLLQLYTYFLGFTNIEQINHILIPLADNVQLFFIIFIVSFILQGFTQAIHTYINIVFGETFVLETRKILLNSIFNPKLNWNYDLGTTSNILSQVIPRSASWFAGIGRMLILLFQLVIIGSICALSLPLEFLLSLLSFSLIYPLVRLLNKKSKYYGTKILFTSGRMNVQLMKSIKNYIYIKILGLDNTEKEKTVNFAVDYYDSYKKNSYYYALAGSVPTTFGAIVVVCLFYYLSKGGVNSADLLTMFYMLYKFSGLISQAIALTNGLNMDYPNFQSLIKILNDENQYNKLKKMDKEIKIKQINKDFSLSVEDLSFSYYESPDKESIFQKINFTLPDKKSLVIKGSSGSGKSTLLMLLIGVLRATGGSVNWCSISIEQINFDVFKKSIGYVGPEPFIIKGTVLENLCYGLDTVPNKEKIINACELANVNSFLQALPNQYDSMLTEQGEGLSMGQKQRLGLARALLRNPKLLVLDEITANLDKNTEQSVISNIKKIKDNTTLIVATHSNAFDEICDVSIEL